MMKRISIFCMAACLSAQMALGQTQPVSALEKTIGLIISQGFEIKEMKRTWLGRIRIEASNDNHEREIVINRVTGEILRDYWEENDDEEDEDDQEEDDEGVEDEESDDD